MVEHLSPGQHAMRAKPMIFWLCAAILICGCNELAPSPGLPAGTPNPSYYSNAAGAIGLRNAAIQRFENAWVSYMYDSGVLTDELQDNNIGHLSPGQLLHNAGQVTDPLDERILPAGTDGGTGTYGLLQEARADAANAIGSLALYDTAVTQRDSARIMEGELYALEGYTEIMLADLFCSGVPLSTLDFQKDFTYRAGSTTQQMYADAIAKFDTALTFGDTSAKVSYLARVGQGRAYLDLGNYAAAADDVSGVPTAYAGIYYGVIYQSGQFGDGQTFGNLLAEYSIADIEGVNGLPFVSSGDPRSAIGVDTFTTSFSGTPVFYSIKYAVKYDPQNEITGGFYSPFVLASGVEARLIQAEAALNGVATGQGSWVDQLNALRTTVGLPDIADPGSGNPSAQIDTLLTERAEWLWLTGHRQGDLRRALRQYRRYPEFASQQRLYPTGTYLGGGDGIYGGSVVVPVPVSEAANPLFHGCLSYAP